MQPLPANGTVACSEERKQDIQNKLWASLQDHVRHRFEQQLLDYVDQTIETAHPSYCSTEGRVIDRRLALRVGMSPGTISRIRNNENSGMTRLSHFLCMMNLCGISWQEIGFPQPQEVVLNAIGAVFPLAQDLLDPGHGIQPPDDETLLLLYFAMRKEDWEETYQNRYLRHDAFEFVCRQLCRCIKTYDIEADQEPIRLIANPKIRSAEDIVEKIELYGSTWKFLMETFPFLGSYSEKSWGCF